MKRISYLTLKTIKMSFQVLSLFFFPFTLKNYHSVNSYSTEKSYSSKLVAVIFRKTMLVRLTLGLHLGS